MPLNLADIKRLESLDLESFEIRGAKYGINNSRTTGTVYVGGEYIPNRNVLTGTATFSGDTTVTNLLFHYPFDGLNATTLKAGDEFEVDSSALTVESILNSTSVVLNESPAVSGNRDFTSTLLPRDYLIEPDVDNNTVRNGLAVFTKDSTDVIGSGTTWLTDLTSNDFIKHDGYQQYFRIADVLTNTTLRLSEVYPSDTTSGTYTAKRRRVDQMYVRYTKDDFHYEKNGGIWELNDGTTSSHILATSYYSPLANGIETKFSHTIDPDAPDLMDTNAVANKVLTQQTQREMFQFPLPAVPYEETLKILINDRVIDRFPYGNQDYVVNYSQDPVYVSPPAPSKRRVANLMFLNGTGVVSLDPENTKYGVIGFVDTSGNNVSGVMPGSERIYIDGTLQERYFDYLFDPNVGTAYRSTATRDETVVGYVGIDVSKMIDYGIHITLNGKELRYSIPQKPTDEVRIVLENGRVVPADKEHPGPGEEYLVSYQVASATIDNERVNFKPGDSSFHVAKYPIEDHSIILTKNGEILDEGDDYKVISQTGKVFLTTPLIDGDELFISYVPLSRHLNGLIYENGKSYCNSYNSRLIVSNFQSFEFTLANGSLKAQDIVVLRVHNETRHADYDLTNIFQYGSTVRLESNVTNVTIGISATDEVQIDYRYESEVLEYYPVVLNNFTIYENADRFYIPSYDATSAFVSGSIIRATPSNAESTFLFSVKSSNYDGEDTAVVFDGLVSEDIVNPTIYVTDSSVSFLPIPYTASAIVSGSNQIDFPDVNVPYLFRKNAALKINDDIYGIQTAVYEDQKTTVTLTSNVHADYTSSGILSEIKVSDVPIYDEGQTEIRTSKPIVEGIEYPGMEFSYQTNDTIYLTTDASALVVRTDDSSYRFDWDDYPRLQDLSSALNIIPYLSCRIFDGSWMSSRLGMVTDKEVWLDSSTILSALPTLRLDGTVTESYQITAGTIVLNNPIKKNQRYTFDYWGADYLGNAQVTYSARYFTSLKANSKITASFEYENLDQFYVQVMSQRQFLERVIEPKAEEDAIQLSGSVGQGGLIIGDENQGNSEGGLVNDEYRRQDTEIECRVFENIYDYFSNRISAFADEMYGGMGLRYCNNDGTVSKIEQAMIPIKAFSRLWPKADYTDMEPLPVAPLTGQAHGPGLAVFTNGSNVVTGVPDEDGFSTIWTHQLKAGDFIRPADSTTDISILSVHSDFNIILTQNYVGPSSPTSGEEFVITSGYPLYDDDGYMGPKIIGTKTGKPRLSSGDKFDCYIDGTYQSYEFTGPIGPYPVSSLSLDEAARLLTANISGLLATTEWVFDVNTTYGYKSPVVLRTEYPHNCLQLGNGAAVTKLGFVPGVRVCGNLDRTSSSELGGIAAERSNLQAEKPILDLLISMGTSNKLDRSSGTEGYLSTLRSYIFNELVAIGNQWTSNDLERNAQLRILSETANLDAIPTTYTETLQAYNNALGYLPETGSAYLYDASVASNWEGRIDSTYWSLDFISERQYIRGKDASNIGVDTTSGPGIVPIIGQTSFILEAPQTIDRRILNAQAVYAEDSTTYYRPIAKFENNDAVVPGTWTGWQSSLPVDGSYSLTNQITFTYVPIVYFTVSVGIGADKTNTRYIITDSDMTIRWERDTTTEDVVLPYNTYTTIGQMKIGINAIPDMTATGSAIYNSIPTSLRLGTGNIAPSADIYSSLRPLYVDYQTISDALLISRSNYLTTRLNQINARGTYLDHTREEQIIREIRNEEILRSLNGENGSLYTWANARFNKTQGCEARLFQIGRQIARNRSALGTSTPLL